MEKISKHSHIMCPRCCHEFNHWRAMYTSVITRIQCPNCKEFLFSQPIVLSDLTPERVNAACVRHINACTLPALEDRAVSAETDADACDRCNAVTEGHEPKNCAVLARRGSCKFLTKEKQA